MEDQQSPTPETVAAIAGLATACFQAEDLFHDWPDMGGLFNNRAVGLLASVWDDDPYGADYGMDGDEAFAQGVELGRRLQGHQSP